MTDIEEHIRKAIEEGKFDDLPGKGKPLNLEDNPLADPEWRLAHHVLKTGGFALPWMEARQELDKEIQAARAALARAWDWKKGASSTNRIEVELEWQRMQNVFREKAVELNQKIRNYNLQTPSLRFQVNPINPEREISDLISSDPHPQGNS